VVERPPFFFASPLAEGAGDTGRPAVAAATDGDLADDFPPALAFAFDAAAAAAFSASSAAHTACACLSLVASSRATRSSSAMWRHSSLWRSERNEESAAIPRAAPSR
jgi:hypothetical protein